MYHFVTGNGIPVVCVPGWYTNSTLIQWFVYAGSINDPANRTGLAHFVEHMMFKGTKQHPTAQNVSLTLNKYGAYFNASTTQERTCYEVHIDSREWKTGLKTLAEMMYDSTIPEEEIQPEIAVVLNEISRRSGGPVSTLSQDADAWIWSGTPYATPVGGIHKDVQAITRNDVLDFLGNYYQPNRMLILIIGDVPAEKQGKRDIKRILNCDWSKTLLGKAKLNVEKHMIAPFPQAGIPTWWPPFFGETNNIVHILADFRDGPAPMVVGGTDEHPGWPGPAIQWIPYPSEQSYIRIDFPVKNADNHIIFAFCNWVACYFTEGMGSVLFQELREEKGLVYSVKSGLDTYWPAGIFSFFTSTKSGEMLQVIRIIFREISRLQKSKLSKKQVDFYRTMTEGIRRIQDESPKDWSEEAAYHFFHHQEIPGSNHQNAVDLTPKHIQEFANTIFCADTCWISCLGPKPSKKLLEDALKTVKKYIK